MKKIIIVIFILTSICCKNIFAQHNNLAKKLEDLNLAGDIKTIRIKETAVKGPKYSLIRKHIISDVEYKVVLNDKVLPIKHIEFGIVCNYRYNELWQLVEAENKYLDKYNVSAGKKVYHFDSKGTLKYELDYNKNGFLKDSIAVSYNNNTVIRTFYTAQKEFFKREEITYNEQGKELINIQEIGGSRTRIANEYDSTGSNKVLEKWYLENRLIQTIKYNYDERGFLISSQTFDERGAEGGITHFEYDLITGLITSIKTEMSTTIFDYNFDVNDNWIVKYEYYNDYPVKVIEREIVYKE